MKEHIFNWFFRHFGGYFWSNDMRLEYPLQTYDLLVRKDTISAAPQAQNVSPWEVKGRIDA